MTSCCCANLSSASYPNCRAACRGVFWPYDYAFPDHNPFDPPFPERIEVPRSADPVPKRFEFFGVKIGDVNFSAEVK